MNRYELIVEKGQYALIQRGSNLQQFAVVSGLDKGKGTWNFTCHYYDFGSPFEMTKERALFNAIDDFLKITDNSHISYDRMDEIVQQLIYGLIDDDYDEAYRYMYETMGISENEAKHFNLDEY